MDAPQERFYPNDEREAMAGVRETLNRRRNHEPNPRCLAADLGYREVEVLAVFKALRVDEGEVLS
jgi:hypothetical protein